MVMDLSEVQRGEAGLGCCCPLSESRSCWVSPGAVPAARGEEESDLILHRLLGWYQALELTGSAGQMFHSPQKGEEPEQELRGWCIPALSCWAPSAAALERQKVWTGTGRRSVDQELRMVWEEKKMNSQRIFLMEIDPTGPSEGFSHPQTHRALRAFPAAVKPTQGCQSWGHKGSTATLPLPSCRAAR